MSQRHLAPLVPFLLWPVGAAVSRWSGLRAPFLAMVAVSIAFTSISTVVWPYLFDSLKNPVFQLAWPLARDGWFPPSIAGSIGVSSRALFVGWMACATAVLIRIAARWYGSGHLGRTGVVVVLLWAGAHVAIARRIEVAQSSAAERERVERDYVLDPLASPIPRTPAGAGRQRGSTPFK